MTLNKGNTITCEKIVSGYLIVIYDELIRIKCVDGTIKCDFITLVLLHFQQNMRNVFRSLLYPTLWVQRAK